MARITRLYRFPGCKSRPVRTSQVIFRTENPNSQWPRRGFLLGWNIVTDRETGWFRRNPSKNVMTHFHWWRVTLAALKWSKRLSTECCNQTQITVHFTHQHSSIWLSDRKLARKEARLTVQQGNIYEELIEGREPSYEDPRTDEEMGSLKQNWLSTFWEKDQNTEKVGKNGFEKTKNNNNNNNNKKPQKT